MRFARRSQGIQRASTAPPKIKGSSKLTVGIFTLLSVGVGFRVGMGVYGFVGLNGTHHVGL